MDCFDELEARVAATEGIILMDFTPLKYDKQLHDYLMENDNVEVIRMSRFDNPVVNSDKLREEINCFNSKQDSSMPVYVLGRQTSFIAYMENLRTKQEESVNKEKKNVDKVREDFVKAIKDRKILENLRTKKHMEFMKEQKLEEQKVIDEIVTYRSSLD